MNDTKKGNEIFLKIFEDRSEYTTHSGNEEFKEGKVTEETKKRTKFIKDKFSSGFLENIITDIQSGKIQIDMNDIKPVVIDNIRVLVDSVTSEVGRALVALTVMQLSIKAICSEQNIRLHKGSVNRNSFSWENGISMRVLDKNFVTPTLRKYNLIKLNADGFMMTRSLAENYPYTKLYKAKLRGAREQWLNIVELLEDEKIDAFLALKYLILLLLNKASDFDEKCNQLVKEVNVFTTYDSSDEIITSIIYSHIDNSDYAARLMEVAMHSLMQVVIETDVFINLELKPLSQMRSANKKHGNIGDIELLENNEIVEAWDAKYGKNYLRDEIDEVSEKLPNHDYVELVGFVTTDEPIRNSETSQKIQDVYDLHGLEIKIISFHDWVHMIFKRAEDEGFTDRQQLAKNWLKAYAESLAQKRRHLAPIDEPCLAGSQGRYVSTR